MLGFSIYGIRQLCASRRRAPQTLLDDDLEFRVLCWMMTCGLGFRVPVEPEAQDEELEWELERTAVSCKALLDSKIEELRLT